MNPGLDGDLDLGSNAIGGGDKDRVLETGRFQVEQAAESADFGISTRPRGSANHGFDKVHEPISGVDIDAGGRVGQAGFLIGHAKFPRVSRWLRRISCWRNGRNGRLCIAAGNAADSPGGNPMQGAAGSLKPSEPGKSA